MIRIINKIAYKSAYYLSDKLNRHKDRNVYYFGFQIVYGAILKILLLITISALLGCLIPAIIVTITFASLRQFAGGHHMETYEKCISISLGMMIGLGLIAQYTTFWNTEELILLIVMSLVYGLYNINKYAPQEHKNKPITDKKKFKILSLIWCGCLIIFAIIFLVLDIKSLSLAVIFGLNLEVFSFTPSGNRLFKKFDKKF